MAKCVGEAATDRKEALQPFGWGSRGCPGQNLAWIKLRVNIARMVWELRPPNPRSLKGKYEFECRDRLTKVKDTYELGKKTLVRPPETSEILRVDEQTR